MLGNHHVTAVRSTVRSAASKTLAALLLAAVALVRAPGARAQAIEPRIYSDIPVGVNFVIVGYAYTQGDLSFAALPITDANLRTSNGVLAYSRSLDLWGKSGRVDGNVVYSDMSGSANYAGQPVSRAVSGFGDPTFRLSINLVGAPALTPQEFAKYRQDLVVGMSLQVTAPWSEYDPKRAVNLGTHRWSFKPEVGISKALGQWTLESQAAVTLYTDNTDFYGGNTRAQDPLYQLQGHVIYRFARGIWTSLDAIYYTGARSTLNGTLNNDLQQNWRVGGTIAFPVNRKNSVKLWGSDGVSARTGNNYKLVGIGWQFRWGAGI
jgi:hypothetical protein